ncbi:hypothetical protein GGI35DRAFT_12032 [Trichoderma velutinum]
MRDKGGTRNMHKDERHLKKFLHRAWAWLRWFDDPPAVALLHVLVLGTRAHSAACHQASGSDVVWPRRAAHGAARQVACLPVGVLRSSQRCTRYLCLPLDRCVLQVDLTEATIPNIKMRITAQQQSSSTACHLISIVISMSDYMSEAAHKHRQSVRQSACHPCAESPH